MNFNLSSLRTKEKRDLYFYIFLIISIIAGIIIRLKGLGTWPLAVDEYYIVKSSENIMKYGLPQWDAGGYYVRALPQQYLTALLILIGLKAEFASRIIPVLANLLAIPGIYLLGKKVSSRALAAALVFVFCFSVWETEFARFARMYTMFQTIFVWYIYFLYKYIFEFNDKAFKWLWILSFFSIFVYEGSIFLVILNFLPIFWDREKQTFSPFSIQYHKQYLSKIFVCLIIFIFAYIFLTFNFRTLFQHNILPPDVIDYQKSLKSTEILRTPNLLIQSALSSSPWLFLTVFLLFINLFVFYKILNLSKSIQFLTASGLLLTLSFLNLLGLFIVSILIFLMLGWLELNNLKIVGKKIEGGGWQFFPSRVSRYLILASIINLFFWVVFVLKTNTWHQFYPHQQISGIFYSLKLVFKDSLNYPYFYETFVLFRETIPFATAIYIILIGALFLYVIKNYYVGHTLKMRFLLFLLLVLVLMQNILNLNYFDTRYFFFLYPLIMLLALLGLKIIIGVFLKRKYINTVVFSFALVPILIVSEDFELKHLVYIDSKEINFRTNQNLPMVIHYYPRWDSETPADLVDNESSESDIIITNEQPSEYYLKRLDYIFRDYRGIEFSGESVSNGTKERWTNAKLLYCYSDLNTLIDTSEQRVWLLLNTMWRVKELDSMLIKYQKFLYNKSIDGKTLLYKIPGIKNLTDK